LLGSGSTTWAGPQPFCALAVFEKHLELVPRLGWTLMLPICLLSSRDCGRESLHLASNVFWGYFSIHLNKCWVSLFFTFLRVCTGNQNAGKWTIRSNVFWWCQEVMPHPRKTEKKGRHVRSVLLWYAVAYKMVPFTVRARNRFLWVSKRLWWKKVIYMTV
jgi:hypothetical protein